jgi:hypothetical protein
MLKVSIASPFVNTGYAVASSKVLSKNMLASQQINPNRQDNIDKFRVCQSMRIMSINIFGRLTSVTLIGLMLLA